MKSIYYIHIEIHQWDICHNSQQSLITQVYGRKIEFF
jgi:hypothetical protein